MTGTFDPISQIIKQSVEQYFHDLEGEEPSFVYDMVLDKVETALFEAVITHVEGNQTKAAKILGINRNTLRKKLKQHNID